MTINQLQNQIDQSTNAIERLYWEANYIRQGIASGENNDICDSLKQQLDQVKDDVEAEKATRTALTQQLEALQQAA